MAQKTIAVKNDEVAYTSPSTAENQNESLKVNANAPTIPAPIMAIVDAVEASDPLFTISFLARWVIVQNKNRTVKALMIAEKAFAIAATLVTSLPAKRVKKRVSNMKIAHPGGWPTSSLKPVAMNSPQSQRLAVGSKVKR